MVQDIGKKSYMQNSDSVREGEKFFIAGWEEQGWV